MPPATETDKKHQRTRKHQNTHKPAVEKNQRFSNRARESVAGPPTKIRRVITGLQLDDGLSLQQLAELTGWQPHTARAALTSLRKKGYKIERTKSDGITTWRITKCPA